MEYDQERFRAKLPPIPDSNELALLYPPYLQLKLLQIVHRHGERTPVRYRPMLDRFITPTWNICSANSEMFQTILRFNDNHGSVVSDVEANGKKFLTSIKTSKAIETTDVGQVNGKLPGRYACFYGQLTDQGRKSMTELGARLRDLYVDRLGFLPRTLTNPSNLYLRATDFDRTQESLQQLVADGLYPPNFRNLPEGNDTLQIRTRDQKDENIYPNPSCRRLKTLLRSFTKEVKDSISTDLDQVSTHLRKAGLIKDALTIDSQPSLTGVLDTISAAYAHNYPIPEAFTPPVLKQLEDAAIKEWFGGYMQNQEAVKLGMGRLLGELKDRMIGTIKREENKERKEKNSEEGVKLAVYSGHDTTLGSFLIGLGAFNNRWPPFSSAVILELHQDTTELPPNNMLDNFLSLFRTPRPTGEGYYVRVRYNDQIVKLPGCVAEDKHHRNGDTSLCTFQAFQEIVDTLVPKDWLKECEDQK